MIHFNGQTLKFRRGDSGSIVISLTSGSEKIDFVDGDTVEVAIKKRSGERMLHEIIDTFTEDGEALWIFEASTTSEIPKGLYKWGIRVNRLEGDIDTVMPPDPEQTGNCIVAEEAV